MTKVTAFILAILVSSTVMASQDNSSQVYSVLNVQEKNITPAGVYGAVSFEKSVGGLICQKGMVVVPGATARFSCTLSLDGRDDAAIYKALNVQEENITPEGLLGSSTFEKKAGNLVCQKQQIVAPNAPSYYSCSIN